MNDPTVDDDGLSVALQIVLWFAGVFALSDALASFCCWLLLSGSGFERGAVEANVSLLTDATWTSGAAEVVWSFFVLVWIVALILLMVWMSKLHQLTPSSPASKVDRTLTVGWVWWLLLVAALVSMVIAFNLGDAEDPPIEQSGFYLALALSMATWAVSCAAGAVYVRQLSRLGNECATANGQR